LVVTSLTKCNKDLQDTSYTSLTSYNMPQFLCEELKDLTAVSQIPCRGVRHVLYKTRLF